MHLNQYDINNTVINTLKNQFKEMHLHKNNLKKENKKVQISIDGKAVEDD